MQDPRQDSAQSNFPQARYPVPRYVLSRFIELCLETPYWYPS